MRIEDALAIFKLDNTATDEEIAARFKELAQEYHPDKNAAGEQMMKLVNAARDALRAWDRSEHAASGESQANYGDALNTALNAIIDLPGLEIEICGAWLWVGGETYTHKAALKAAGFKYASKKQKWNFRPDNWRSSSRGSYSMDQIRKRHGSARPTRPNARPAIHAA